jgi:hypothetical protein
MINLDIAHQRLHNQLVTQRRFEKPGDVVQWLGAVQARITQLQMPYRLLWNDIRKGLCLYSQLRAVVLLMKPPAPAACQRLHLSICCPALSDHEIRPVAKVIQVRSFGKASTSALPQQARLRQLLSAFPIYFALRDARLRPSHTAGQREVIPVKTQ